jgi:hypothetical protein
MNLINTVLEKISSLNRIESYNSSDQSIYIKTSKKRLFREDLFELIISINRNESNDNIRLEGKYNNDNEIIMITKGKLESILIENNILDDKLKFKLNQLYENKRLEKMELETIIDSLVEIEFVDWHELKILNKSESTDMLAQALTFYIDLFAYEIAMEFNNYIVSNKIKAGYDILGICNEVDTIKFNINNLIKPPSNYFMSNKIVNILYRHGKVNGSNVLVSFNPYLIAIIFNDLYFKLKFDPRIQELININKIHKESIDEISIIISNKNGNWYTEILNEAYLATENIFTNKTDKIVNRYNEYLGSNGDEFTISYISALDAYFESKVINLLYYMSDKIEYH